uniref:Uncharacterized protein n=1 Tax=Romanomermis culicivorax TaxID=13658 RepID=A0A915HLI7_ROMCU
MGCMKRIENVQTNKEKRWVESHEYHFIDLFTMVVQQGVLEEIQQKFSFSIIKLKKKIKADSFTLQDKCWLCDSDHVFTMLINTSNIMIPWETCI